MRIQPLVLDPTALQDAHGALDEALRELPASAAPGLAVIGALKSVWARARAAMAQANRSQGGPAAAELLAENAERALRRLLEFAAARAGVKPDAPAVSLLAMGSFGRREPAPYSDLDILVLHDGRDLRAIEELAGLLLRPLWDAGLDLGHAVRTPAECLAAIEDDSGGERAHETATSLLEARFVAGDAGLADRFLNEELREFFRRRGRPFVERKLEEALRRHLRQGASVYRTQPHLKDSPGALRDYQLALWIDRSSQLSGHLARLTERPLVSPEVIEEARAAHDTILRFRIALQTVCARKQDVLDFGVQAAVAEELGYQATEELRASEQLLGDYFGAAKAVHRLADTVIRRYREEQAIAGEDRERLRRQPLDADFTRVGDYLYLSRQGVFDGDDWLQVALRGWLHASRFGLRLGQEIREAIRGRLADFSERDRRDPEAAQLFRALLNKRRPAAPALRAMRDVGLLGEYLPEFGQVQGLVIHDVYHDFTVDEHTLFALEYVDRMLVSEDLGDRARREALDRLPRLELLRLALLYHDLGKSRGGAGHAQRGALMVPGLAERLGLSEADARLLIFLVENHLLLSRTSARRDTGEEAMLAELAGKAGSPERLDLLYLLTCADTAAVGQGSFPHWKDALVTELYQRLAARLAPADLAAQPAEEPGLAARLMAAAGDEEARAAAREHCAQVPPRYLLEVSLEEAQLHLELLRAMREGGREAVAAARPGGGLVDVWVVSTDRPRRFAQICGALLGAGANVVSAIAYTRRDGLILDRFRASIAPDFGLAPGEGEADYWAGVARQIEDVLEGRAEVRPKVEAARRRIPRAPAVAVQVPVEVRLDNKLSDRHTVVDVVCADRVGLLYGLSRALSDLGCDIHFAKIDTQQGAATDVFYVTELGGGRITDQEKLHNLRLLLLAVAGEYQQARR